MQPSTKPSESKFYSPLATICLVIVIYFTSQILSGVVISAIPLLLRWTPDQADYWLAHNTVAQFLFMAVADVAIIMMVWWFLKKKRLNFRQLGITKPKLEHIGYALMGFCAYFILYILGIIALSSVVPGLNTEQKQELGFSSSAHGIELGLIFFSLVLFTPLAEEIVMRGFLYTNLRAKLPVIRAALITSLLFAVAHLGEGGSGSGLLWVLGIDTFILSLVLCYMRERSKSLWPSIGVHMIKNGLAFVILFNIVQIPK